jgi:hypothetical protein
MVTLFSHTSHVLQPLDVIYFKSFKNAIIRDRNFVMIVNNYLKPNKIMFVGWVDKVLEMSLKYMYIITFIVREM